MWRVTYSLYTSVPTQMWSQNQPQWFSRYKHMGLGIGGGTRMSLLVQSHGLQGQLARQTPKLSLAGSGAQEVKARGTLEPKSLRPACNTVRPRLKINR